MCFPALLGVLSLTYVTRSAVAREGNAKPAAYTTAKIKALGPAILKQDKPNQWRNTRVQTNENDVFKHPQEGGVCRCPQEGAEPQHAKSK